MVLDLIFLFIFTAELVLRAHFLPSWTYLITTPALALDTFIVVVGLFTEILLPLMLGEFGAKLSAGTEGSGDTGVVQV